MIRAVHAFADEAGPAQRLGDALGVPHETIALHTFPDGESLPTVTACEGSIGLYRSLDRPDGKVMPLILAADALRRRGARRIVLIAPYLCYMRQDAVFHAGEPLSRDVVGGLLGERFDAVLTVDPHLHRTKDLSATFGPARVMTASAGAALAAAMSALPESALVVGLDVESGPWVAALAGLLCRAHTTFSKTRRGDRDVAMELTSDTLVADRPVLLVDDICSSGATLEASIRLLKARGAGPIDVAVVHALFDAAAARRLAAAGMRAIISTDSCPHPSNRAPLAGLLAAALKDLEP